MISVIKIEKIAATKVDLIKDVLFLYCYMKDIKLSDSVLKTLSFIVCYGLNQGTLDLVVRSKIVGKDTIKNVLSQLRKYNFIIRVNKTDYLSEEFKDLKADKAIGLILKINNA